MAIEQKVIMKELKDLIEFNFKVKVLFVDDGCYEESPMFIGDTEITGKTNEDENRSNDLVPENMDRGKEAFWIFQDEVCPGNRYTALELQSPMKSHKLSAILYSNFTRSFYFVPKGEIRKVHGH